MAAQDLLDAEQRPDGRRLPSDRQQVTTARVSLLGANKAVIFCELQAAMCMYFKMYTRIFILHIIA